MNYNFYLRGDYIISPKNSYSCKRITKQNIKQFGFNSIEELLKDYPGFPLVSEKYRQNLVKNSAKGKISIHIQVNDKIEQYNLNPKKCKQCNTPITYDRRRNNYCNQSCSASYNNRLKNISEKQREKAKNHMIALNHNRLSRKHEIPIKYNKCIVCNNDIPRQLRIKICHTCKSKKLSKTYSYDNNGKRICKISIHIGQTGRKEYRRLCNFALNKKDYPSLYDNTLLKTYGWYSPSNKNNNLTGVSFDHLYRVEDGFKNNVPPEIMKHPANAELVPHNINQLRQKSTITLDELLLRIQLWDLGERNLKSSFFVIVF